MPTHDSNRNDLNKVIRDTVEAFRPTAPANKEKPMTRHLPPEIARQITAAEKQLARTASPFFDFGCDVEKRLTDHSESLAKLQADGRDDETTRDLQDAIDALKQFTDDCDELQDVVCRIGFFLRGNYDGERGVDFLKSV